MALVGFPEFLDAEGLSLGLAPELLELIRHETESGIALDDLLSDEALAPAGLGAQHLLRVRRAVMRYAELAQAAADLPAAARLTSLLEIRAWRWALKQPRADEARQQRLAGALIGLARETLKRGRLRIYLKRPDDPRAAGLTSLAGHTEGCDDIPPHRWFAAERAMADGLVWIEVCPPQDDPSTGPPVDQVDRERLERALAGPVLAAIAARSERQVLASAAKGMRALLARPVIPEPVAGIAADNTRLFAAVLGGADDGDQIALDRSAAGDLTAWLAERSVATVGLSRIGGRGSSGELLRVLNEGGLTVVPIRSAGLMKQARGGSGPVKAAAARVVARRLKDPLTGYAELEPDELGLGEYLDRIDPTRLKAALDDARSAARIERATGGAAAAGLASGISLNPMIKDLTDLRAGLEVTGIVVNLTHFGAFVDLGLQQQGLIHVSELSADFVQHPWEVVQVGQQVRARIVEVDLDRGRIGLSLRAGEARRRRPTQATARKALDDLFKK